MANTKLIINGEREFLLGDSIVSIGRVPDNSISFPEDSNVSRFHAEIEPRDGDFWLIELGSSNGTAVNGTRVTSEVLLKDGDEILFGGTSSVVFEIEKEKSDLNAGTASQNLTAEESADESFEKEEAAIVEDTNKASKMPMMLGVMGIVCGLAVILVVSAVIYSLRSGNSCDVSATIISPRNGETISKTTEIAARVESNNGECVQRVVFLLEGKEFASSESDPYKVSLEPGQFAGYASDGRVHSVKVAIEDVEGNLIPQEGGVGLIFETLKTPTPTPEEVPEDTSVQKKVPTGKTISIAETQEMLKRFNNQFSPALSYKCGIPCLQDIQKKVAEFTTAEGYSERAKGAGGELSDTINVAFVTEMNLPAPLPYYLAMSRTKFIPQKQNDGEGLWRMSPQFAKDNSLMEICGENETLSDPSQVCASRVTALYMSKYLMPLFDKNIIYSVAAFGMSPTDAGNWKNQLQGDRMDFWNSIKNAQQRDQVIRFLAAGIVAENPQRFGLKKDQPMSNLYKIAMGGI